MASGAGRFEFEFFTKLFQDDFSRLGFSPIGPDGADRGAVVISWEYAVEPSVVAKDALLGMEGEIAVLRFLAVGGPFGGEDEPGLTMAELSIIHVHHKEVSLEVTCITQPRLAKRRSLSSMLGRVRGMGLEMGDDVSGLGIGKVGSLRGGDRRGS